MIVDTSALIAIMRNEPEAEKFARLIAETERVRMSVVSYVEAGVVLDRSQSPVVARRDFGKGSGHRVALNFGDCFSYALASETGEPLLFKGDDFARTDITPAVD